MRGFRLSWLQVTVAFYGRETRAEERLQLKALIREEVWCLGAPTVAQVAIKRNMTVQLCS